MQVGHEPLVNMRCTKYVPDLFTVIDFANSPVDHLLPEAPALVSVTEPPLQNLIGPLALTSGAVKVIQGVRELFEIFTPPSNAGPDEAQRSSKLVLIGRHLEGFNFEASLRSAM